MITLWRTADWHEREIYDMMGIRFRGHPDLRRILMWEGYGHHPLLKDFPLSGKPTDVPEVAFTESAPMAGGPFVTVAGGKDTISREPRVRIPETDALEMNARVERRNDIKEAHGKGHGPGPIQGKPSMRDTRDIEINDAAARAAEGETVKALAHAPAAATEDVPDVPADKMILNMGPSHPATHGVLRIILELEGEVIIKAVPEIGYLHRGDEKIAENMTYTQFIPYTDRLDYLAPLANNVAYALAVEKLLGIDKELTPRCQFIRVICAELARISSHLLGMGSFAMDVGAMTIFLHTFTEREKVHDLCESISGARFTTAYTRIGGLSRDLPPGWVEQCRKFCNEVVINIDETETFLTRNRIFMDRTQGVGTISREDAIDLRLDWAEFARQRRGSRPAETSTLPGLRPT